VPIFDPIPFTINAFGLRTGEVGLAPEIQNYIRNLSPTNRGSVISDRQWMRLARIRDHAIQRREFQKSLDSAACKSRDLFQ
jgi:hypothetical protein